MKILLLVLFLVSACSTTRYYKTAEVGQELKKNATQLDMITTNVERDYLDKESFFKSYYEQSKTKDSYALQDMTSRLQELRIKRDLILAKSTNLKKLNDGLLAELDNKKLIKESDPTYEKIEKFAKEKAPEATELFKEYSGYKNASGDFTRSVLFNGNALKKSTSIR